MTDTKRQGVARAQETSARRPRRRWAWLPLILAVIAAGVLTAVLWWPDGDGRGLSENPPFGLTGIEMPETGAAVIAALERMPEIDGRQPTFLRDEVMVVYEGTEAEAPGIYRSIGVVLDPPPGPDESWDPEDFLDPFEQGIVDAEQEEGWVIEASALDPDAGLVWVAATDLDTEDGIPAYYMMWADPLAGWHFYYLAGDTAEFRVKLVHAFIGAVGD